MSSPLQQVHWISQSRGLPILYILLSIPVLVALSMMYVFATLGFPQEFKEWYFYGLFLIWLPWLVWVVVTLTGPDGARPAKVQAAAARLSLLFSAHPAGGEPVLPKEFPLAQASTRWLLPSRRGPKNMMFGEVEGQKLAAFDVAYPFLGAQGRCETTAVYFLDPVPGLPDWPMEWVGPDPGIGNAPPPPFAAILAANPIWTIECRDGRLLVYRLFYLCDPESFPEFLAAATEVHDAIAAASAGTNQ